MREEKTLKNSRIIPTSSLYLSDKEFHIETYMMLYINSYKNNEIDEVHRYIYVDEINVVSWSRHIGISPTSFRKYINHMKEIGIIKENYYNGFKVYKLKGKYETNYLLFENDFLEKLISLKEKNIVKLYMVYYKYSKIYGSCKLKQEEILKEIGLSCSSRNNHLLLTKLNTLLQELGLISIDKKKLKGKFMLEIVAPIYYATEFYK